MRIKGSFTNRSTLLNTSFTPGDYNQLVPVPLPFYPDFRYNFEKSHFVSNTCKQPTQSKKSDAL